MTASVDLKPRLGLAALAVLAAGYLWLVGRAVGNTVDEGFIATGTLRVLAGELPHRDFVALYTGALYYWNGLLYRLSGVDLLVSRIPILAVQLGVVVLVYRFVRRLGAGRASGVVAAGTTLAYIWHFVGLPAWYSTLLTLLALGLLLGYHRTGQPLWLIGTGLTLALSFLMKQSAGLFASLAALSLLLLRDSLVRARPGARRSSLSLVPDFWLVGLKLLAGLGVSAMLIYAVREHLSAANVLALLAVPVSLALLPAFLSGGHNWNEPGALAREIGWLSLGLAIGVGPYFGWYAVQGEAWTWIEGVFFRPTALAAVRYTGLQTVSWRGLALAAVILAPSVFALVRTSRHRRWAAVAFTATALVGPAIVLWARLTGLAPRLSADLFQASLEVFNYLPFVVYAGTLVVLLNGRLPHRPAVHTGHPGVRSFALAGLVIMGSFLYLTIYPQAYPQYFSYVSSPAFILLGYFVDRQSRSLGLAGGRLRDRALRCLPFAGPAVLVAVAVIFHILPGFLNVDLRATASGGRLVARPPDTILDESRARLYVGAEEAATIRRAVAFIGERTGPDGTLFVYGYQPMLYYLTGLRNPTPFIDPIPYPTPAEHRQIVNRLDASKTPVVVLFHGWPARTDANAPLQVYLRERYAVGEVIGEYTLLVRREALGGAPR